MIKMEKIILTIILILGIILPLRELYIDYKIYNGFPKFNFKTFILAFILFLLFN